jgi:hypothetical protein
MDEGFRDVRQKSEMKMEYDISARARSRRLKGEGY